MALFEKEMQALRNRVGELERENQELHSHCVMWRMRYNMLEGQLTQYNQGLSDSQQQQQMAGTSTATSSY